MKRKRQMWFGSGVALLVSLAISPSTASGSPTQEAFDVEPLRTVDTLSDLKAFAEEHPANFGGIYYDQQDNSLHVNLTVDQRAYEASAQRVENIGIAPIRGTANHEPRTSPRIVVHQARHSYSALKETMTQVLTSETWAAQSDEEIVYWGINPRVNKVEIGLSTVTPRLRQTADDLFGDRVVLRVSERLEPMTKKTPVPDNLKVVKVNRNPAAVQNAAGPPLVDFAPQSGGARMWRLEDSDGDGNNDWLYQCTAGFKWYNGSGVYSLASAGHCGPLYQPWTQGYLDEETGVLWETGPIGTPYARSWFNGGTDSMLMDNGEWIPRVWENVTTGVYKDVGVMYTYGPVPGQYVCFSGSFTGTKCSASIRTADTCVKIGDVVSCHQTIVQSPIKIVQHGDSGGPVFYGDPADGIGVGAAGTISAATESGKVATFTNREGYWSNYAGDFALSAVP